MSRAKRDGLCALLCVAPALLIASISPAGPAQAHDRAQASIIGGSTATTDQWPWAAFVLALNRRDEGFTCTGTVVAPTLILTAAHCIKDIVTGRSTPVHRYRVVTASGDVRDKSIRQVSEVARAVVYPGFDPFKLHGDAGLLVLRTPTTAPAVALATRSDMALLGAGLPTYIAGWGISGGRAKPKQSPILNKARTYLQRFGYCRNHARVYYPFYNSTQLCTITPQGFGSGGTCHGDSGGPALGFRGDGTAVQIGITSLGPPDCNTQLPDIFTRVDRVATWVGEWIARTAPAAPVVEG